MHAATSNCFQRTQNIWHFCLGRALLETLNLCRLAVKLHNEGVALLIEALSHQFERCPMALPLCQLLLHETLGKALQELLLIAGLFLVDLQQSSLQFECLS